ncbi:hypothetical protein FZI91_09830 [Mycobacterium sp. CBMA271]|uniref:hypothetical protein n=1 Tax=unclassified Mycobacteroides TaxID=2618759 RepID=UPI0013213B05|nr:MULTISPECIES: hypothetical protein [unclassified Mycobacteroides]MUM15728.1 hypothetical protein [Mycobacteroides sp. CBMA 326]MUM17523.1 hypothetical protein [Mycobacteroides sp. CBMA 326]MUM22000.1 hypothetical protein [Mycobacteroides sp. CBMA 271]
MNVRYAGLALIVAGALLAAPPAHAAPDGDSAADVIADLESRGNIVIVNRVGNGAMADCKSTAVRQGRFLAPGASINVPGGSWGGSMLVNSRVVYVDITC